MRKYQLKKFIKSSVRFNKKTVTIPMDAWKLIEVILDKLKLEVPEK